MAVGGAGWDIWDVLPLHRVLALVTAAVAIHSYLRYLVGGKDGIEIAGLDPSAGWPLYSIGFSSPGT